MEKKVKGSRRRFIGRLTALAAAAGATVAGLLPELSAAGTPPPPSPPPTVSATALTGDQQSQLYSAALNDSDVVLLLSGLAEAGRLDPPTLGYSVFLDANNTNSSITLPVVSYASGATIAVVYYGALISTVPGGSTTSYPLKAIVTNAGVMNLAGGGKTVPTNHPEWIDAYFSYHFPEEYLALRFPRAPTTTPSLWTPDGSAGPNSRGWKMDKVMYAGGGALGVCDRIWRGCINTPIVSGCIAFFSGIACMMCALMVGGALVITGPGGAVLAPPAIGLVLSVCATALAALTAMMLTLANCNLTYNNCVDDALGLNAT